MQIIPDPYFALWMTLPFLVTLFALNVLIVRPMREFLDGRDEATAGARHDAKHLVHATEVKLAQVDAELGRAREQVVALRAAARQAAIAQETALVDTARHEAAEVLTAALAGIAAEGQAARASLRDTAVSLSNDIAGQVLGRDVAA